MGSIMWGVPGDALAHEVDAFEESGLLMSGEDFDSLEPAEDPAAGLPVPRASTCRFGITISR